MDTVIAAQIAAGVTSDWLIPINDLLPQAEKHARGKGEGLS